jgi:ketosteroid isomerase-like protein
VLLPRGDEGPSGFRVSRCRARLREREPATCALDASFDGPGGRRTAALAEGRAKAWQRPEARSAELGAAFAAGDAPLRQEQADNHDAIVGAARGSPCVDFGSITLADVAEHPNALLARRIFDAFERKDAFVLRELFAHDVVWRVGGTSGLAGVYRGRREIIRFLGSLPRLTNGTYASRLTDVLASENRAAVLYRATGIREGRTLDIDQLLLFTIRDGCVADVVALPSDQGAFDAFWG